VCVFVVYENNSALLTPDTFCDRLGAHHVPQRRAGTGQRAAKQRVEVLCVQRAEAPVELHRGLLPPPRRAGQENVASEEAPGAGAPRHLWDGNARKPRCIS